MEKVSRQDAIEAGLTRYYTGQSCKNGHVSERNTKSATCLDCIRAAKEAERRKIAQKRSDAAVEA